MGSFAQFGRTTERIGKGNNIKARLAYADKIEAERNLNLDTWYYELGGQLFVDWVTENYRTYTGSKLLWNEPYVEEMYLLFGNPWFERVVYEKAAQMGFTECLIAFSAFALAHLHIALGIGFETQGKTNDMVGQRFQPSFDYCPQIQKLTQERRNTMGRGDIDNKSSLTVGGVTANFFYGSLPKGSGKGDERQAPSKISSFTAQMILGDEYELWSRKVLDIVEKRMQASVFVTKPMRYGSTPGAEGGLVDTDVKLADYLFQWYVTCPHCGTEQYLDPFGNFLKSVEMEVEGKMEELFIDPTGRPLDWFAHDPKNKKATTYIGCSNPDCGEELLRENIDEGHFRCRKHNITLREACEEAIAKNNIVRRSALRMPMLASHKFDPIKTIKDLFSSESPVDVIQQGLGKPASFSSGGIAYKRIEACVGLALPQIRQPDLTVLTVDVGRYGHPAMVQNWYFGEGKTYEERWVNAHKEIVWYGKLKDLEENVYYYVRKYRCHIVVMDNEPEFIAASNLALKHKPVRYHDHLYDEYSFGKLQVFLIDQMALKVKYKRTEREVVNTQKDKSVVVYNIDRTWGIDQVKTRIYRTQQHFPAGLIYDPEDPENNLISHYMSSNRTPDGIWVEDKPDHLLLADSAAESVVFALKHEKGVNRGYLLGTAKVE